MKEKIVNILLELNSGLIEREEHIKIALLTMLAGENLLLVGPPGTAKSEISRRLASVISDADEYEYLLTKFTTPDELFGPISISKLQEDIYERKTEGYIPNVNIVFLDEIFKANSSILNSLLTILNERIFHDGNKKKETKILSFIGASNELPKENPELQALYDRFLTRIFIDYISEENKGKLLLSPNKKFEGISLDNRLKMNEIEKFHNDLEKVEISQDILSAILKISKEIDEDFIEPFDKNSDRRLKKSLKILKASALSNERSKVNVLDVALLSHVLWNDDVNREEIENVVLSHLPINDSNKASKMEYLYEKHSKKFDEIGISGDKVSKKNEEGKILYLNQEGKETLDKRSEEFWSEEKHLISKNGEYLYLKDRYENDYKYSKDKNDKVLDKHYIMLCYKSNEQKIECIRNKNKQYMYINKNPIITNTSSKEKILDYYDNYHKITMDVPLSKTITHQPSIGSLKNAIDELEIRNEQIDSDFSTITNILEEIKKQKEEIENSLSSHLWINVDKLSFIKNSLIKDLEKANEVNDKFKKLSDTIKLYYKKAIEDKENYRASLQ